MWHSSLVGYLSSFQPESVFLAIRHQCLFWFSRLIMLVGGKWLCLDIGAVAAWEFRIHLKQHGQKKAKPPVSHRVQRKDLALREKAVHWRFSYLLPHTMSRTLSLCSLVTQSTKLTHLLRTLLLLTYGPTKWLSAGRPYFILLELCCHGQHIQKKLGGV